MTYPNWILDLNGNPIIKTVSRNLETIPTKLFKNMIFIANGNSKNIRILQFGFLT